MHPAADDYPQVLKVAVDAVLREGVAAGEEVLSRIAYPPREIPRRPSLPRSVSARIYVRDRFHCRYCGRRVIPTVIMELLGSLYPDSFPFHPAWKGGLTHPAILSRSPVVDHVIPGSSGGDWSDEANLVTACWPCNAAKADLSLEQIGWSMRPIPTTEWNGLTSAYPALWRAAGEPKPRLHQSWLRAFESARAQPPQPTAASSIISAMFYLTDDALLAELAAKRDWLRSNPTGMAASVTKRKIKELEREATERGLETAAVRPQRRTLGRSVWWVVDAKETASNRSLHTDRTCMHLADSQVREATEREQDRLTILLHMQLSGHYSFQPKSPRTHTSASLRTTSESESTAPAGRRV